MGWKEITGEQIFSDLAALMKSILRIPHSNASSERTKVRNIVTESRTSFHKDTLCTLLSCKSINQSTFIRNGSTLTPQRILNSTKHAQKGWKLWKHKNQTRRQRKWPYGLRVSCPLEADIKQKHTVKTTHTTVHTKLMQIEKFNCPVPSAKKFNLKVGFLWANFT